MSFIVHEDLIIYGSAGTINVGQLYDIYNEKHYMDKKYTLSGTYKSLPYECNIKHMEEMYIKDAYELILTGKGLTNSRLIVHPKQTFWLTNGNTICVKDINKPHTQISALNGALDIDSVGRLDTEEKFYYIEPGDLIRPRDKSYMQSLYASNLILLPIDNADDELPFFMK